MDRARTLGPGFPNTSRTRLREAYSVNVHVELVLLNCAIITAGEECRACAIDGQAANELLVGIHAPDGLLTGQIPNANFSIASTRKKTHLCEKIHMKHWN